MFVFQCVVVHRLCEALVCLRMRTIFEMTRRSLWELENSTWNDFQQSQPQIMRRIHLLIISFTLSKKINLFAKLWAQRAEILLVVAAFVGSMNLYTELPSHFKELGARNFKCNTLWICFSIYTCHVTTMWWKIKVPFNFISALLSVASPAFYAGPTSTQGKTDRTLWVCQCLSDQ